MKHQTNDLLRSALGRVNRTIRGLGFGKTFDISKIRQDWSPKQNLEALRRLMTHGRHELINDVNSGTRGTGLINRYGDAAIAQYLLVQKGASAPATNVAVFTSGTAFGVTLYGGLSTTEYNPVRLLLGGQGTVNYTSDVSAAIAVGDPLVGVSGGTVKTVTGTGAGIIIVGIAIEACSGSATGTDKEFEAAPTWSKTY
jgi:hypothetical protein